MSKPNEIEEVDVSEILERIEKNEKEISAQKDRLAKLETQASSLEEDVREIAEFLSDGGESLADDSEIRE